MPNTIPPSKRHGYRDNGIEPKQPRQPHARIRGEKAAGARCRRRSPWRSRPGRQSRRPVPRARSRLDSRARTMARRRLGISSRLITLSITGSPDRAARPEAYHGTAAAAACSSYPPPASRCRRFRRLRLTGCSRRLELFIGQKRYAIDDCAWGQSVMAQYAPEAASDADSARPVPLLRAESIAAPGRSSRRTPSAAIVETDIPSRLDASTVRRLSSSGHCGAGHHLGT